MSAVLYFASSSLEFGAVITVQFTNMDLGYFNSQFETVNKNNNNNNFFIHIVIIIILIMITIIIIIIIIFFFFFTQS